MSDPNTIQFEITEAQHEILLSYVSDMGISSWIEAGTKIDIDKYRISVNTHQLNELIDYVQFLVLQADQKKAKDQLRQLAAYLEEQQTDPPAPKARTTTTASVLSGIYRNPFQGCSDASHSAARASRSSRPTTQSCPARSAESGQGT